MIILTKECFPTHDYNKLDAYKIGHVDIVEKSNLNAYSLKLRSHVYTSNIFNVKYLVRYHETTL